MLVGWQEKQPVTKKTYNTNWRKRVWPRFTDKWIVICQQVTFVDFWSEKRKASAKQFHLNNLFAGQLGYIVLHFQSTEDINDHRKQILRQVLTQCDYRHLLPKAIAANMWTVILRSNKIPQILTGVITNTGCLHNSCKNGCLCLYASICTHACRHPCATRTHTTDRHTDSTDHSIPDETLHDWHAQ